LLRPVFGLERSARSAAPERTPRRSAPVAPRVAPEHGVPQDIN
jgi:hypothetical protein